MLASRKRPRSPVVASFHFPNSPNFTEPVHVYAPEEWQRLTRPRIETREQRVEMLPEELRHLYEHGAHMDLITHAYTRTVSGVGPVARAWADFQRDPNNARSLVQLRMAAAQLAHSAHELANVTQIAESPPVRFG